MSRYQTILDKLTASFAPAFIDLVDESHMHSVPKGAESHFRLLIVSEKFNSQSRVARSRLIYEVLNEEMKSGIHALAQRSYTPEEWQTMNETVEMSSPPCFGGSKLDD